MIALIIAAALVNWIATTIIIDSTALRPVRSYVKAHRPIKPKPPEPQNIEEAKARATKQYMDDKGGWRRVPREHWLFVQLDYFLSCHLCVGVWVAIAEVLYVHSVVRPGLAGFFFTALLIKAGGHLILELRPQSWKYPNR